MIQNGTRKLVTVLSVSQDPRDHERLEEIFRRSNWIIHRSQTPLEATQLLNQHEIAVVICDSELRPGWRWLLEQFAALPTPPVLVVACRDADGVLWTEVLNLGAYDVLAKPFERAEVTRIVSLAWLYWKDKVESVSRKDLEDAHCRKRSRQVA